MGVKKKVVPWCLSWWVLIPLLLTGIGIIPGVFLGIWRVTSEKYIVECPNCDETLITQ